MPWCELGCTRMIPRCRQDAPALLLGWGRPTSKESPFGQSGNTFEHVAGTTCSVSACIKVPIQKNNDLEEPGGAPHSSEQARDLVCLQHCLYAAAHLSTIASCFLLDKLLSLPGVMSPLSPLKQSTLFSVAEGLIRPTAVIKSDDVRRPTFSAI